MMQPDDPPFLTVGTEVSAKYKGAFCEAKVNKVVKIVKVKVAFKYGLGSAVVSDECIKGVLKVGSQVKALHPDKNQHLDGIINKIQDCSQYTVVFDDGDITTLRRSSLCLKSGRHFAESETLDQLPLTHPEHFGTPVVGGRRGRRSRHNPDSDDGSSDEEHSVHKRHRSRRDEWEDDAGKVVCVEVGDKKKQKDNWFPGLVVAPTAQDTVKIETKKDYLVRSFHDGRYYTVPKKEATLFSREVGSKVSLSSLKAAVEKALQFIDKDELPPHWDRDILFGNNVSDSDLDRDTDSDSSDDEPREEKDHFVAQLYKYMEECGTPINKAPMIGSKDLDLYKLFNVVQKQGGFNRVMNQNQWKVIANKMSITSLGTQSATLVKSAYKRYLQSFEDFYRKLGCTMVSSPRGSRTRHRSGRSLIRDCDKNPRPSKRKGAESCDSADDDTCKRDEDDDLKSEEVAGKSEDSKHDEGDDKEEQQIISKKDELQLKKEEVVSNKKEELAGNSKGEGTGGKKGDGSSKKGEGVSRRWEGASKREGVNKKGEAINRKGDGPSKKTEETSKKNELGNKKAEVATKKTDLSAKKESAIRKAEMAQKKEESANKKEELTIKKEELITKKEEWKKELTPSRRELKRDTTPSRKEMKQELTPSRRDLKREATPLRRELKMEITSSRREAKREITPTRRESKRKDLEDLERKKEDGRLSRNRTPPVICSPGTNSPTTRERSKENKGFLRSEGKARQYKKALTDEEVFKLKIEEGKAKVTDDEEIDKKSFLEEDKKEQTESEDEIEVGKTRYLRNREEKDKDGSDPLKKCDKKAKPEHHQRSTSCNSTSSGTSSSGSSSTSCTSSSASNLLDGKNLHKMKMKSKQPPCPLEELRKRGRKKKLEGGQEPVIGKSLLPAHVPISVGDKLRVLYGPNKKETKVTYEAKVLELDEENPQRMYYVHYLGWNTRYDEWVVRQRVAQNLTWCQTRGKKGRSASLKKDDLKEDSEKKKDDLKETESDSSSLQKKGRLSIGFRRESEPACKATTRSESTNQSSSESPLPDRRRRSRRKNASMVQDTEEETDSEDYDSESEPLERTGTDIESSRLPSSLSSSPEPHEYEKDEKIFLGKSEGSFCCGKDIDMKAIESEMKGLDKPIKKEDNVISCRKKEDSVMSGRILAAVIPGSLTITEKKKHDPKKPFDSPAKRVEIPVRLVPAHEIRGQIKPLPISGMKKEPLLEDDIYEFKEPEPFEMGEMRSRKEGKSTGKWEEGEPEVKLPKKKGRPRKEGDDKSESDSDAAVTPQKRASSELEPKDSPSPDRKSEPTESPLKKDYSRKSDIKDEAKDIKIEDCRKSESPPCLQIKETEEGAEKPYFIDVLGDASKLPPSRVPIDLKNLTLESLDGKEIHMIGSSVVVTPKKLIKLGTGDVSKIDPIPIKNESDLILSPKAVSVEKVEDSKPALVGEFSNSGTFLCETNRMKPVSITARMPGSHVLAQVVMSPVESRLLAKSKGDLKVDKGFNIPPGISVTAKYDDGKPVPFSQRQQHIFPHLLKRSENAEDKESSSRLTVPPVTTFSEAVISHSVSVPAIIVEASGSAVSKNALIKTEPLHDSDKSNESFKIEPKSGTVEESIEAVVIRARQDLKQSEEEKKVDIKNYDKKRRNLGRSKKALSREFLPDSSEESDGEKEGGGRMKRFKGEGSKHSPSKRLSRGTSDGDRKLVRMCDDEERANDADEEDNESNFPTLSILSKEAEKRRKETEGLVPEAPGKESRMIMKRRRSSLSTTKRAEDAEETGLSDLLCEETIPPGSPMPHEANLAELDPQGTSLKQEMPFASVPTGSSFGKRVPHLANVIPVMVCDQISSTASFATTKSSVPPTVASSLSSQITQKPFAPKCSASTSSPVSRLTKRSLDSPMKSSYEVGGPSKHSNESPAVGALDMDVHHDNRPPRIVGRPGLIPNIDNTPPTTPESIISTLSDSPRGDDETPKTEGNDAKSGQYLSELDFDKTDQYSEDSNNTMDSSRSLHGKRSSSTTAITCTQSPSECWDTEEGIHSKRRKRSLKMDEVNIKHVSPLPLPTSKRKRLHSASKEVHKEEEIDTHGLAALSMVACSAGAKSRFNFCQELDPDMDASKRISELQNRMQDLKRTYMQVKSELASVERRRKKLRRKEKEKESQVEGS